MITRNEQYSTTNVNYKEEKALQQLLEATNAALTRDSELSEATDYDKAIEYRYSEFTITVAGCQTAFICGGPQIEALYAFIQHIAAENFYTVDIENCTVER